MSSMSMNLVSDELRLMTMCVSPCSREDWDTRAVSESYPLMLRGIGIGIILSKRNNETKPLLIF